jgi:hypothetical protein
MIVHTTTTNWTADKFFSIPNDRHPAFIEACKQGQDLAFVTQGQSEGWARPTDANGKPIWKSQ